jgi:serine/threonine protein kinase
MSAAPDVTDDDLPRPFGSYLLLQNFARGGMGDVYLAKSGGIAGLERVCVLKKLRSELTRDREYVTRFIDEARVVVTLNHANICNVFDVGRVESEYYLAMEYVSGRDVRAFQERCRKLEVMPPPLAALYITCEVLEALDYAHRRHHPVTQEPLHLVHRDISPQNVLVSYEGEVKLIDFGLAASRLKVERTQPNVVMGKMAYMPPEQARGDPIDSRADLFACGVLAYELLTNERYYEGMSATDIWQVAGRGGFMPRAWGSIEPALTTILAKALHPEPRRRFATCGDFRDALHGYMRERLPGNAARIVRQLMEQLFEEELARERAALARFGAITIASVGTAVEQTKSQSVSIAGGGAGQRTDETSGSHAGRMPPPTVTRSTEEGSPVPASTPGLHDDPTRIDQERPASSTKQQTEPSHDRADKPVTPPVPAAPSKTPGPLPAASPSSAAPRMRSARPAGAPPPTTPRAGSPLPAPTVTTGAPSMSPRGSAFPAAPVTTGAPSTARTGGVGSLPAASPQSASVGGQARARGFVPDEGTQRLPRRRKRGDATVREDEDEDATVRHRTDDDEDDATVRHRTDDDDDATVRHRIDDEDGDRTDFDAARARTRMRWGVVGFIAVFLLAAVVVAFALRGATSSSAPAGAPPTGTAGGSTALAPAPEPAATAASSSADAAASDAGPATRKSPSRATPAAPTSTSPSAAPMATAASRPEGTTTRTPSALAALNAQATWQKLEVRAPTAPCVVALMRRVKFDGEPFETTAADIQRCAAGLNIAP